MRFVPCKKDITARAAANLVFEHVVSQHGFPLKVFCDRDSKFMSEFWTQLWGRFGTQLKFSYPYDHRAQGSVERSHKTIEQMLRCYVNKSLSDWDQYLYVLEFAMNSTVHSATGYSPFFLDMGREPVVPILAGLGLETGHQPESHQNPWDFVATHQRHLEIARDAILQSRSDSADHLSQNVRDPRFEVGDLVLLSTENKVQSRRQRKLRHHWVGPFRVTAVFRNGVEIDLTESGLSSRLSRVWSNTHVKRYSMRADSAGDGDTVAEDTLSVAEFLEQSQSDDQSSSESESGSESDAEDVETLPQDQWSRPRSPREGSVRKSTPSVVNHLTRNGQVWYYMRTEAGVPPAWYSRDEAVQVNEEAIHHYERCRLPSS